jgi:hypothetical protein
MKNQCLYLCLCVMCSSCTPYIHTFYPPIIPNVTERNALAVTGGVDLTGYSGTIQYAPLDQVSSFASYQQTDVTYSYQGYDDGFFYTAPDSFARIGGQFTLGLTYTPRIQQDERTLFFPISIGIQKGWIDQIDLKGGNEGGLEGNHQSVFLQAGTILGGRRASGGILAQKSFVRYSSIQTNLIADTKLAINQVSIAAFFNYKLNSIFELNMQQVLTGSQQSNKKDTPGIRIGAPNFNLVLGCTIYPFGRQQRKSRATVQIPHD